MPKNEAACCKKIKTSALSFQTSLSSTSFVRIIALASLQGITVV